MRVRSEAAKALARIEKGEKSTEVITSVLDMSREADPRDRALFTRLVKGALSRQLNLDHVLDQYSRVKTAKIKPLIRNILRVGVYQLLFCDNIPANAVCNEAVKSAKQFGFESLSGFVNGILRRVAELSEHCRVRNGSYMNSDEYSLLPPNVRASVPEWLWEKMSASCGEERAMQIFDAFNEHGSGLTARMLTGRLGRDDIIAMLEADGIKAEPSGYTQSAVKLSEHPAPGSVRAFREGYIQYQDISSILAVEAAGIRAGEKVLDLCAAPGGKTIAAADITGPAGHVTACDIGADKLEKLRENVVRCSLDNIEIRKNDALVFEPAFEEGFDTVIADLPCSGLGTIGHKPEIRYRVTPENINELSGLQYRMLQNAVRYVKPGGKLVFSTCTVTYEENFINRDRLLDEGLVPERLDIAVDGAADGFVQLLPDACPDIDGFFISCYRKVR